MDASDHPFGLSLMLDGTCRSCQNLKSKTQKLGNLDTLLPLQKKDGRYDCIVPVQGTAEDFFVVSKVVESGRFPLLFFVNNYFCNEIAWQNVHGLIELYDLEMRSFNPDLKIYKKLVGYSFRKFDEILFPHKLIKFFKTFELAKEVGVKSIISGEQQPEVTVGKFNKIDLVENTKWSFQEHELGGRSINSLFDTGIDIHPKDLEPLIPVKAYNREISWSYLSNYVHWDQWKQDADMVKGGAKFEMNSGSFDAFYRAGNGVYYEVQDVLRHKKFGHFKLRDHLSREIRQGRISLSNAKDLYVAHSSQRVFRVDHFFKWLGVSKSGLDWIKYNLFRDYNFSSTNFENEFEWQPFFSEFLKTDDVISKKNHVLMDKGV